MTTMFGLEGSGFIVAIGVTLLLVGAVAYYCNSRLSAMEKALVKQNQVLGDFISNVRVSLASSDPPRRPVEEAGSVEALTAARKHYASGEPADLITVSEDENGSDDEADDDLESSDDGSGSDGSGSDGSDIDSDDEASVDEIEEIEEIGRPMDRSNSPVGGFGQLPSIDITSLIVEAAGPAHTDENSEVRVVELSDEPNDELNEESNPYARPPTPPVTKTIKLGDIDSEEELEQAASGGSLGSGSELSSLHNDTSTNVSATSSQHYANGTINLRKVKVQQLKEMAVAQGVATSDAVKKMKKADLIKALKAAGQ